MGLHGGFVKLEVNGVQQDFFEFCHRIYAAMTALAECNPQRYRIAQISELDGTLIRYELIDQRGGDPLEMALVWSSVARDWYRLEALTPQLELHVDQRRVIQVFAPIKAAEQTA